MPTVDSFVSENETRFLEELEELLRIPSVGALAEHRTDMDRCARHLAGQMRAAGMTRVDVMPTAGMPVVYGERLASPGSPTVLVYGHFDVQPVDPVDLWTSPPFEPEVRDGVLFARGAADDKGQLHIHLKAIETLMKVNGSLPVNVKMIVEGEEEVGSEHLHSFIAANTELLKADFSLISDTSWFAPDLPSICYGLRGLVYMQVNLRGADSDLHSGGFGGAVANPIQVLSEMIAALKDDKGRVAIPGFYDRVRPLADEERQQFASLPFDEKEYLRDLGAPALCGEEGYTTLERTWARPTLDPNGIWGGFTGEGAKTVLPSRASAKLSCRLVPDQEPDEIFGLLESRLRDLCPPTVTMETVRMHDARPALTPLDHPAVQAAARALERVFRKPVAFVRSGGSIPVVASFQELLGIPTVLMGFSLPDDHAHAPDERMGLANYYGGIKAVAYLLEELGKG